MSEHGSGSATDKGIGFAVLFGLLAVAGALVMYLGHGSDLSGWAFAAVMVLGTLLVAGLHVFGY